MRIHHKYSNLTAYVLLGLLALLWSLPAWAGPTAELLLQKRDPYLYGACGWCTDLFSLKENDNRKNFNQYNARTQTGYYQIDIQGPAGTTVTLFGSQNYGLDHGYLILVKKDDRPLAIEDLDDLPANRWVDVNTPETGVYRMWYHPAEHFNERIASVRWGQWWSELPAVSGKE